MRQWLATPQRKYANKTLGEVVKINTNAVLAVSAMLLSAISAFGVIWQARVASEQREAAVWPYVQAFPNRYTPDTLFSISLTNVGVGPAVVRYFSVRVDGMSVRSWREFLAAISEDEKVRKAFFDEGVVQGSGWVLPPNTPLLAFTTREPEAFLAIDPTTWSRIDVTFCYCSVFDSCWVSAWAVSKREDQPTPVGSCPVEGMFGVDYSQLNTYPITEPSRGIE